MDPQSLKNTLTQVYKRYPEIKGIKPKIRAQQAPSKGANCKKTYLLTFHKTVKTDTNQPLSRWVRVVVSEQGRILKISTTK